VKTIPYTGRFAPSPTGPLHAGSLVAALASWLDARAHGGRWLVRIEDVDTPRCATGAAQHILAQLAACGLVPDEPPLYQSTRSAAYQAALDALLASGQAYGCACSRQDIALALRTAGGTRARHSEWVYPGTCREGVLGRVAKAVRLRTQSLASNKLLPQALSAQAAIYSIANSEVIWCDRRLGPQRQCVATEVGDFVLKRADGLWAYQLAVVVDDAAQGISHVVRGQDLADNTARQIWLQHCLGLPSPQYLHTALVMGADGHKLSKQNGARPVDLADPLHALQTAGTVLGLHMPETDLNECLQTAVRQWTKIFVTENKS
jgi:glutamyl-Q tRNA(Asp) synthetase